MYKLGESFVFDYESAKANEDSIIRGEKFRFTILTDRLVRLEYNESGIFEDRPTELMWYRTFEKPQYTVREDERYLEITTSYFKINYLKERRFKGSRFNPSSNLKVELLNTERSWYYSHPEIRNFGSPSTNLMTRGGKTRFKKALYSPDGYATIDDSESMIMSENGVFIERENKGIDIYLFMYYKDFNLALQDYFKVTGKPALLPRYSLGNWWSRNETYNDNSLKEIVDEFVDNKIPMSVLLLNKDWHLRTYEKTNNLSTGFTFNKDYFKHPYEMIKYLHSKGIRIGLNIDPTEGIYPYEEYFETVLKYLEANKDGIVPFNVMDPRFIDVYFKILIHPLDALDVDFYWLDPIKYNARDLTILKHYQYRDTMRNYKKRPMVLAPNTNVASHRYPILYSGETVVGWTTLNKIPFHNLSASNIGVSWWAHDIGGYSGGIEDNELYTRFVQLGVFSPIMKFGSEKGKYYKREPWRWSVETATVASNYLRLRHRLIPYLYTEAYNYHNKGIPFIRPLYHHYPEFYDDYKFRNDYFFGSQMFISPIISKKEPVMNRVIHRFFIPDGVWYDFVTGKKFPGGRDYVSFFREQDYPVFVKAGSIIPLGDNENLNDTTPPKNMEIQIFPGRSNLYELYEDDGVSDLYKRGFFLKTSIDYNYLPNNYTVIIRAIEGKRGIIPDRRNYKVRFRNTKQSNDVVVYYNNTKIDHKSYTDGPDFIVEVDEVLTIGQLTINCKGNDIEIDAVRLINDDIEAIIGDLPIETVMKEKIDEIIFSDLPIKKKRIEIRRLRRKKLEPRFVKLFLKLLEYIEQV